MDDELTQNDLALKASVLTTSPRVAGVVWHIFEQLKLKIFCQILEAKEQEFSILESG